MKSVRQPLGAVMVDIEGTTLAPEERERLLHPQVGGVVLFSRNFEEAEQLRRLCETIHALRDPPLLIAVDHEGGRVQRFRQAGFTPLPAMAALGRLHDLNPMEADAAARRLGWLMAAELLTAGVDFSFAPVVDLDHGRSEVIGDRSFHAQARTVATLAGAFLAGMHEAGMSGVAKHFPGHGYAAADSHVAVAVDERPWAALQDDLLPFRALIRQGVEGVMPAHVVYPQVDAQPAGFSSFWLQTVLRGRMGFEGAIVSDDLSMAAARAQGEAHEIARQALGAGCDMVLVLNDTSAAHLALERLTHEVSVASHARMIALRGHPRFPLNELRRQKAWRQAHDMLESLNDG